MSKVHVASFSETDTLRQCPHKHTLAYRQRWTKPPRADGALARGTAWHRMMEAHYLVLQRFQKENPNSRVVHLPHAWAGMVLDAVQKALWDETGTPIGVTDEQAELLWWMYQGYVEHFGIDHGWEIVAVEWAKAFWLPTPTGGRSRFQIKMKIDLVVRQDGNLWVVDHKTGKDLPKQKDHDLDDQFGLYTWGLRQLGANVFGQIYNAARTQRNKDQVRYPQPLPERFTRNRMARTDRELDSLALDAYRDLRAAYQRPEDEAPRHTNPDTCNWRCDFTEPCLMGRKGMDERQALEDFGFVQDFTRH